MEMTQKYWLQYLVLLATSLSRRPTRYFRMSAAFGSAVFALGTADFTLETAGSAEDCCLSLWHRLNIFSSRLEKLVLMLGLPNQLLL